ANLGAALSSQTNERKEILNLYGEGTVGKEPTTLEATKGSLEDTKGLTHQNSRSTPEEAAKTAKTTKSNARGNMKMTMEKKSIK
ncbi:hypothetical protein U1Q18_044278, partial [Sarracenia purpurea var. burkii]